MSDKTATITAMAKELREGESLSRSVRMPLEGVSNKAIRKKLSSLRNSMNQIAARARETTQRDYTVESGQFIVYDGSAVVLTCVMTCMTDEGEDDI